MKKTFIVLTLPPPPWRPCPSRTFPGSRTIGTGRCRPIIQPGTPSTQAQPGKPPSDAIVLFNGKDLSGWVSAKGGPAKWKVGDGYFETSQGNGDIDTVQSFGDCQLHVEWAAPNPPHGEDQDRGNSGVYLMKRYEIQVLDSYQQQNVCRREAAAVYGQYPPLVNDSLPPGEWQTYDIVFHGPRFAADGSVTRLATVTSFHNGVLVQDHVNSPARRSGNRGLLTKFIPSKQPLQTARPQPPGEVQEPLDPGDSGAGIA